MTLPGSRPLAAALLGLCAAAALAPLPPMADTVSGLPLASGASFTVKLDGQDFKPTWVLATQTSTGGKDTLNLSAHAGEGPGSRFLNCSIVAPHVGSIPLGGSLFARTSCSFHTGGSDVMEDFSFDSGSIELTALDANTVSGSFKLAGKNHLRTRELKDVEGTFVKIPVGAPGRLP